MAVVYKSVADTPVLGGGWTHATQLTQAQSDEALFKATEINNTQLIYALLAHGTDGGCGSSVCALGVATTACLML